MYLPGTIHECIGVFGETGKVPEVKAEIDFAAGMA